MHADSLPLVARRSRSRILFKLIVLSGLFVIALFLDIALKYWAQHHIASQQHIMILGGVLELTWTRNHGAVFGIGQGKVPFFIAITFAALGLIGYLFWRSRYREHLLHITLTLILAGALGNLYDRIAYGYVRDMLHMFPTAHLPFGWTWPNGSRGLYPWVFNLADVYLTTGIVLFAIRSLFVKSEDEHNPETNRPESANARTSSTTERT